MTTVRLDSDLESRLDEFARMENVSKTDIIKSALEEFLDSRLPDTTPYGAGAELFGKYGSGISDNSENYKSRIKGKLNEKHAH